jgi:hypothetical protein
MRTAFVSALLAAAVTCAVAPKAPAQDQYMAQADSQLARIKRTLGPRYSESRQMIHRGFSDATPQNQNFTWDRASYVVAAAGDIHVAGIKLRLYNENNVIVAADTSGSRTPRISVTVPDFGTFYRLEMAITSCSEYPCYIALMPYQRQ